MLPNRSGLAKAILNEVTGEAGPQPSGSGPVSQLRRGRIEDRGDSLTITVPAKGLLRGHRGFLWTAIICFVVAVFALISLLRSTPEADNEIHPAFVVVPFSLMFFGAALLSLYRVIQLGTQHVIIDVVPGQLLITSATVLRSKQQEWAKEDLASVGIGKADFGEDDTLYEQFEVRSRAGERIGYLHGLPHEELRLIVEKVKMALGRES